jgi:hypothetical protein
MSGQTSVATNLITLPIQPIAPQLAATRFGPQRLVGPVDNFTARCGYLETVKPSLAYLTLKVLIGTAVADAFWIAHPTVLE